MHPLRVASALWLVALAIAALGCGKDSSGGSSPEATDRGAPSDATVADSGGPGDAAIPADSATAPDAAPPVVGSPAGDAGPRGDAGTPTNPCEALGGLCLGQSTTCTNGGGTVSAAGASGCVFSDGPGVCCIPPEPQATGADCRSHGGLCAPIAGCNFTSGNFAPPSCGGLGIVCCVPQKICGPETMACCNASTTFRPACDRGAFVCTIAGTTLKPRSECP